MITKFYKIKDKLIKACEKDPYFWVHTRIVMNHCYNILDDSCREYDTWQLNKYMRYEAEAKYVLENIEEAGFITSKYSYDKDDWVYGRLYKVNISCADLQYFELMMKNLTQL